MQLLDSHLRRQLRVLTGVLVLALFSHQAPATIVTVSTAAVENKLNLSSIEVTSGTGNPNRVIAFDQMIKARVTDYLSVPETNAQNTITVFGTPDSPPVGQDRLALVSDAALNTGIFNPSDTSVGLTLAFDQPLINGPGDDLVLFELTIGVGQTPDPCIVRQPAGAGAPLNIATAQYQKSGAIPIEDAPLTYIVTVANAASATLNDLVSAAVVTAGTTQNPKWYAVPIDLSALGIADWASIGALEFLSGDRTRAVDPLLVAGLPPYVPPLNGDYNRNGSVDATDYVIWRHSLGQLGFGLAADGTGPNGIPDGGVDQFDYDYWRTNFGATATGAAGAAARSSTVPEPTALTILGAALVTLMLRRGRIKLLYRQSRLNGESLLGTRLKFRI